MDQTHKVPDKQSQTESGLTTFARTVAYDLLEPVKALAQPLDKVTGSHIVPKLELLLDAPGSQNHLAKECGDFVASTLVMSALHSGLRPFTKGLSAVQSAGLLGGLYGGCLSRGDLTSRLTNGATMAASFALIGKASEALNGRLPESTFSGSALQKRLLDGGCGALLGAAGGGVGYELTCLASGNGLQFDQGLMHSVNSGAGAGLVSGLLLKPAESKRQAVPAKVIEGEIVFNAEQPKAVTLTDQSHPKARTWLLSRGIDSADPPVLRKLASELPHKQELPYLNFAAREGLIDPALHRNLVSDMRMLNDLRALNLDLVGERVPTASHNPIASKREAGLTLLAQARELGQPITVTSEAPLENAVAHCRRVSQLNDLRPVNLQRNNVRINIQSGTTSEEAKAAFAFTGDPNVRARVKPNGYLPSAG